MFQPPPIVVHLPSVATLWPYMEVKYIFFSLMQAYSQCEQLLDAETVGGGVFRPDVADPEMSQACTTSLWELVLFRVCIIVMWRHNVNVLPAVLSSGFWDSAVNHRVVGVT